MLLWICFSPLPIILLYWAGQTCIYLVIPAWLLVLFMGHDTKDVPVWSLGGSEDKWEPCIEKKETLKNSKERQLLPYLGDKYMTTEWRLWEAVLQSVCQWDKSQWFWTIERNTIWTTEVMWQTKPFIINFSAFRLKKQMMRNSPLCWHQQCFWTRANPEKEPKTL